MAESTLRHRVTRFVSVASFLLTPWIANFSESNPRGAHIFMSACSSWNKIEHRLFSFITMNGRGRPLRTYETIVSLIGSTTNSGGLVVKAVLDRRNYPTGKKVTPKQMREINIEKCSFHGDWNYSIRPRAIAA